LKEQQLMISKYYETMPNAYIKWFLQWGYRNELDLVNFSFRNV